MDLHDRLTIALHSFRLYFVDYIPLKYLPFVQRACKHVDVAMYVR
jgi:hypothetical protein